MAQAERRKYHYIYKTTNILNDKYYIGMHSTDNLEDGYVGSGQRLWKSISRYGKDNHKCEIIEFLPTRELLRLKEREIVNEEIINDVKCLNLALGGNNFEMTQEQIDLKNQRFREKLSTDPVFKAKFSENRLNWNKTKGREVTSKTNKFRPQCQKGSKRSPEVGLKIREKVSGENNGAFGTAWISNGSEVKRISKFLVSEFLEDGWNLGRKQGV